MNDDAQGAHDGRQPRRQRLAESRVCLQVIDNHGLSAGKSVAGHRILARRRSGLPDARVPARLGRAEQLAAIGREFEQLAEVHAQRVHDHGDRVLLERRQIHP